MATATMAHLRDQVEARSSPPRMPRTTTRAVYNAMIIGDHA